MALFIAGLILDYETLNDAIWQFVYFGTVGVALIIVVLLLLTGLTRQKETRLV